jgi:hypothetical protein
MNFASSGCLPIVRLCDVCAASTSAKVCEIELELVPEGFCIPAVEVLQFTTHTRTSRIYAQLGSTSGHLSS